MDGRLPVNDGVIVRPSHVLQLSLRSIASDDQRTSSFTYIIGHTTAFTTRSGPCQQFSLTQSLTHSVKSVRPSLPQAAALASFFSCPACPWPPLPDTRTHTQSSHRETLEGLLLSASHLVLEATLCLSHLRFVAVARERVTRDTPTDPRSKRTTS